VPRQGPRLLPRLWPYDRATRPGLHRRVYGRAPREDAEEAYGDFVDAVETATEALADMRDRFGSTLDEDAAEAYEDAFNRAVRKRWPELGLEIENR